MKTTHKFLGCLVLFALLSACSSDNAEDITKDCSDSDLALSVLDFQEPSCTASGFVRLEATGGSGNYEYSSNGTTFQPSPLFEDFPAGEFIFTVRDEDGCQALVAFELTGTNALTVGISASGCDGSGMIEASVSGGDGSYEYQLNDGDFGASNTFENLSAGTYTVTVRDGSGCSTTSVSVVIKESPSLSSDIVSIINSNCAIPSCHGGSRSPSLGTPQAIIANASRIQARTSAGTMPPAGRTPLSSTQIQLISDWVDCGAQDN